MASRTAVNRFFPLLACLTQYSAKMARVEMIAGVAVPDYSYREEWHMRELPGTPRFVCCHAGHACLRPSWDLASTCSYTYFVVSSYACRAHRSPRFRRSRVVQGSWFPPLP
jgi:hypothetical protein